MTGEAQPDAPNVQHGAQACVGRRLGAIFATWNRFTSGWFSRDRSTGSRDAADKDVGGHFLLPVTY